MHPHWLVNFFLLIERAGESVTEIRIAVAALQEGVPDKPMVKVSLFLNLDGFTW